MNKLKISIWNRDFELPITIRTFDGEDISDVQREAVDALESKFIVNGSSPNEKTSIVDYTKPMLEDYILKDYRKPNNLSEIDNIFKYVIPRSIYIPYSSKRTIAILCNYKFDAEHGLAIVFEEEQFKKICNQDEVI